MPKSTDTIEFDLERSRRWAIDSMPHSNAREGDRAREEVRVRSRFVSFRIASRRVETGGREAGWETDDGTWAPRRSDSDGWMTRWGPSRASGDARTRTRTRTRTTSTASIVRCRSVVDRRGRREGETRRWERRRREGEGEDDYGRRRTEGSLARRARDERAVLIRSRRVRVRTRSED